MTNKIANPKLIFSTFQCFLVNKQIMSHRKWEYNSGSNTYKRKRLGTATRKGLLLISTTTKMLGQPFISPKDTRELHVVNCDGFGCRLVAS